MPHRRDILVAGMLATLGLPLEALAHHGWAWAEDEEFTLTGVIRGVRLGNPHGELDVEAADGLWTAEIGQPYRNDRAGLTDDAPRPRHRGDARGPPLARSGGKADEGRAGDHRRQALRPLPRAGLRSCSSSPRPSRPASLPPSSAGRAGPIRPSTPRTSSASPCWSAAIVPMDLRLIGLWRADVRADTAVRLLRPVAAFGAGLAVLTGAPALHRAGTDYVVLPLFYLKITLVAAGLAHALAQGGTRHGAARPAAARGRRLAGDLARGPRLRADARLSVRPSPGGEGPAAGRGLPVVPPIRRRSSPGRRAGRARPWTCRAGRPGAAPSPRSARRSRWRWSCARCRPRSAPRC